MYSLYYSMYIYIEQFITIKSMYNFFNECLFLHFFFSLKGHLGYKVQISYRLLLVSNLLHIYPIVILNIIIEQENQF